MSYKDFLCNKRVAFVGASPILKGHGLGEKIDSYDVVIKSGGSLYLKYDEYYKDYGKRLDVNYVNVQFVREMCPLLHHEYEGISWICTKSGDLKKVANDSDAIQVRNITPAMKFVDTHFKGATMGAYILQDIMMQNPKELYVTGIDFFISKKKEFEHDNYQEYLDGYLPPKIRDKGNIINKGKKEDGHDLMKNTLYMKSMFDKFDNMHTDVFIQDLLNQIIEGKIKQQ